MKKLFGFLVYFFLISSTGLSQNSNDNCENAIDITSQLFIYAEDFSCGYQGAPFDSNGTLEQEIQYPTIDSLQYNSQQCMGYSNHTTDNYPDVWFKSRLHDNRYIEQSVFISYLDTLEVALYYGQCGQLFQSQCFTLASGDSLLVQPIDFKNFAHHSEDDMFLQIKLPPGHQDAITMCFTIGLYVYSYESSFGYYRPATTVLTEIYDLGQNKPLLVRINPNPAKNEIKLEAIEVIYNIELFNQIGTTVAKSKPYSKIATQDISFLPPGMYWIRINTSEGWVMSSILVLER